VGEGEPKASGGQSNPALSQKGLERVKGIEPSYSAWEAAALPLSYTRLLRSRGGIELNPLTALAGRH
jgi:hypothetical protein